ncbi:diphosphate--fructose-6-phosphate 1-phosphotransferase [Halobacillus litoralis]|uniref:Diphosphate--fructose-6-phosphate 1-phosphotransferase n=1 Tax=Halobacillus litoralis TaxID=45668 RepID=A0A845DTR2_9BACI|nr:diphosphate--fructose-6-phosphate 1-phosphotransferase [Halobacillus litoralis]MYL20870.1 diphosphate--fructose-6-phosphate 1-phosphotransferase [Halobacillus litoralis]
MKHVAVGQAGGPTAVINATLAGFVDSVKERCRLTFIEGGYKGLVEENFLAGDEETVEWIKENRFVPGACLQSGRYPFEKEEICEAVRSLKKNNIDTLVFIGGNGTMEALFKVKKEAERQDWPLQVIGLPKTVDNDLGGTDHAPGFASAAKYIAKTTKDLSRDLYAMKNFEQVRVLETMGRNAGWLAAAAGAWKEYEEEGPHFTALPEQPLNRHQLLKTVQQALDDFGYALIVVSEGVQWEEGSQIELNHVDGRTVLGGISKQISEFIGEELKVNTRAELLGMNQRADTSSLSTTDSNEAYRIGEEGGNWVFQEYDKVMAAVGRRSDVCYTIEIIPVKLETVIAEGERLLPAAFIKDRNAYYEWLAPLMGGDRLTYPPLSKRRVQYSEY